MWVVQLIKFQLKYRSDRGIALAMRWVVQAAKDRGEKTMVLRLAAEIV